MKDVAWILDRANILKGMHNSDDRARIRAVMNGGAEGVRSVLSWNSGRPKQGPGSGAGEDTDLGVDLPTANVMYSGLERLAQKVGREPVIKTDMIPNRDTNTARKKAEKRARIVRGWDETSRMEMQYPQIGRWLPGYGFTFHAIRERVFGDQSIPVADLRDPFDVYPGMWGVDQQPTEAAIFRMCSKSDMSREYPHVAASVDRYTANMKTQGVPIIGQYGAWEGHPHSPLTIVEYYNEDGTYIVCPEMEMALGFIPNPLLSGPAFVMTKRFSFDQLQSQYHHVFGLMSMMAKLNILGLIATEDAVFRETNIIGEMVGNNYDRGRFGVNLFEPGARIEKPTGDQLQQTWQAVNILERQFRTVANYDVAQDGVSPNSFATGQGIRELGASADENVKEYQTAIKNSVELIDRKRLEWEQEMHPQKEKKVYWYEGGTEFEETYVADKDIDKDYRTQRVYGAMATFDENSKIIAGLQLVQARVMDRRTMQENLDGFHNVSLINERIDQDQAKEMLISGLGQRFGMNDPAAGVALASIMDNPKDTQKVLTGMFAPKEQQGMTAQEVQQGAPPDAIEGGPPPAVQTVLAQMESQGGGAQSVGQF
jgi:hypothetical protein